MKDIMRSYRYLHPEAGFSSQHQKIHHAEKMLINALERCADPDDTPTM
jgi:hypothetical protein